MNLILKYAIEIGASDIHISDRLNVVVEKVMFHSLDEKEGKGYALEIDDIEFSQSYINALGLCIYPML